MKNNKANKNTKTATRKNAKAPTATARKGKGGKVTTGKGNREYSIAETLRALPVASGRRDDKYTDITVGEHGAPMLHSSAKQLGVSIVTRSINGGGVMRVWKREEGEVKQAKKTFPILRGEAMPAGGKGRPVGSVNAPSKASKAPAKASKAGKVAKTPAKASKAKAKAKVKNVKTAKLSLKPAKL